MSSIGADAEHTPARPMGSSRQSFSAESTRSLPPKQMTRRPLAARALPSSGTEQDRHIGQLVALASSTIKTDPRSARILLEKAAALIGGIDAQPATGHEDGAGSRYLAPWQMKLINEHIDRNIGGPIRNSDLAKVARLSISYFSRIFRYTMGQPPHAHVIDQRVRRAKDLMTQSGESLSQIAFACGFADQAHFSRIFRQTTGQTPISWRRARDVPVNRAGVS